MDTPTATLPIHPPHNWSGPSAPMKRPKEIACFSYTPSHEYRPDASGLRYYYPPRLGADLCKGFETFEKLDESQDDHLDSLLKTIVGVERERGGKVEVDVVTWRGMMTKLLACPFEDRDGFEMNATFYQGTIFIEENHEYKVQRQARQSRFQTAPGRPSQDMMSYWGYKFETLSLLPDTWDATSREYIEGREDQIVNNAAQYCSVVQTGIGDTSLIIGGEVDAIWDSKPPPPTSSTNFVELKTSLDPSSPRDLQTFERKLLKFWLQSFLLGVPKIIVGFRSANGILRRLEELETAKIPGIVKKRGGWDGNVAVNFGAGVLSFLRETVVSEGVWRIRRKEKSGVVECWKVEEVGHGEILSEEFINWRIKLALGPEGEVNGESEAPSEEQEGGEA
ncbi:Protein rai1 [Pseudogymnoascus verrucosus]|uniref:Decapping nuclease n=1 Tax=Pseudogymnoascus verrucosus TaxID=342668 RepID=A0A1B8GI49_9PEZI|nr:Protein rai1 [Pseudogymnoascus verrucosus]OBT95533.1 Protein rai1 [Pseudogymnoascus verrucosus]